MTDILMPALSPTMEEGALSKWHVKVGDKVSSGDVIAEIETDKATMEVEAVDEGVVDALLVQEGAEGVKVNTPIARLKSEGDEAPAPAAAQTEVKAPPPSPATTTPKGSDQKPQTLNGGGTVESDHHPGKGPRLFVSPLARRIAEQKGVDLSTLKGSGPHGRIVKDDVDAAMPGSRPAKADAVKARETGEASAPPTSDRPVEKSPAGQVSGASPSLEQMGVSAGSYDLIPLDGMRRTIARRMTESARDIPHFPLTIDLEIDRLLDARVRINAALEKQGVKVSVNDLLIKASAAALKAVPEANASYSTDGIALHHNADVAVAVAIEGGLITPIIRAAETRSLADIATAMKDLAERARTRKLKPEEFQGGTFSLSNLGMFGVKAFSSIINEPQGCILSVGAGEKRPVVRDDALAIATVMTVTLTCDHRAVDGATGARWLQAFKRFVEDPVTMLACEGIIRSSRPRLDPDRMTPRDPARASFRKRGAS